MAVPLSGFLRTFFYHHLFLLMMATIYGEMSVVTFKSRKGRSAGFVSGLKLKDTLNRYSKKTTKNQGDSIRNLKIHAQY
jgi:hypothetical protein